MAKEQEVDQVIGRQVREARKRLRVQQTELARRLAESGVSMHQATVARLERGERVATVGDIFDVAATLGVSPLWLLSGSYTDEPVPVLDRAYGPGQMRFWLRAEAALPGTSEENFATVVPDRELHARLRRGVQHLRRSLDDYLEAAGRRDWGAMFDAINDLRGELDRQEADLEREARDRKDTSNG